MNIKKTVAMRVKYGKKLFWAKKIKSSNKTTMEAKIILGVIFKYRYAIENGEIE